MKVLYLSRRGSTYDVSGGVDSAVLRPGEPVFVPDPTDDWLTCVCPAVIISLLGSHIPVESARRHYNRGTLLHLTLPRTQQPVPSLCIDRAVAPGQPFDVANICNNIEVHRCAIDGSGDEVWSDSGISLDEADKAIAFLSKYMTLKTGDLIAFESLPLTIGAPILDTKITASIGDIQSLEIRIK